MNKQFENYSLKALYHAKVEQIIQTYQQQGFSCQTRVKIDGVGSNDVEKTYIAIKMT